MAIVIPYANSLLFPSQTVNKHVSLVPRVALAPPAPSPPDRKPTGSSSSHSELPKLEPFSQSRISRSMPAPSLLEKAEHALQDRCMALEGEEAYKCWEALFEFEDIKEEYKVQCEIASSEERSTACRPLERFENLVRQSNGVSSLIDNVRMMARTSKMRKASTGPVEVKVEEKSQQTVATDGVEDQKRRPFPEPAGLPPTEEELELEKSAMMPESPFTRLLRTMGLHSSWYTQPPDFETD